MSFPIEKVSQYLKTEPNEAVFWHGRTTVDGMAHGGPLEAMEYARQNDGKTLEMCMLEHREEFEALGVEFDIDEESGIFSIEYGDGKSTQEMFEACSKCFAEQASGEVRVLEGSDDRFIKNSKTDEIRKISEEDYPTTFKQVEHPSLCRNDSVDSIVSIETGNKEFQGREIVEHSGRYGEHDMIADYNNPDLFQENKPGEYVYEDGPYGKASTGNLTLAEGERNLYAQRQAGGEARRPDDDGGHLIGTRFNGSGESENLDAQNYNANRGEYKNLEDKWEEHLRNGDKVFVHVEAPKEASDGRPEAYSGYYIVEKPDGTRELKEFSIENENLREKEHWEPIEPDDYLTEKEKESLDLYDPSEGLYTEKKNPEDEDGNERNDGNPEKQSDVKDGSESAARQDGETKPLDLSDEHKPEENERADGAPAENDSEKSKEEPLDLREDAPKEKTAEDEGAKQDGEGPLKLDESEAPKDNPEPAKENGENGLDLSEEKDNPGERTKKDDRNTDGSEKLSLKESDKPKEPKSDRESDMPDKPRIADDSLTEETDRIR